MSQAGSEIQSALSQAIAHHRAGRLDQAIAAYQQALALAPDEADIHNNLAMAMRQRGRLTEAITEYQTAIKLNPDMAEVHNNLGIALKDVGQIDAAIAAYRRALALKNDMAGAWHNLGFALAHKKEFDQAIEAFEHAIAIDPKMVDAHNNLGGALIEKKRFDQAIASLRRALDLNPNFLLAHTNLGKALLSLGNYDHAVACYRRALELASRSPLAQPTALMNLRCDLAHALVEQGNTTEAVELCRQIIAAQPNFPRAHAVLGGALARMHRHSDAIAAYRRAIALRPNDADVHWTLANELLLFGDYAQGWSEYEWESKTSSSTRWRAFAEPLWDGSELHGKTILLDVDQGFGDTIQFIRYLPLVAQRGGRVLVQCQPALHRLFSNLPEADQVIAGGQPLPSFDVHCPLPSLPRIFKTELDSIPASVPYLWPDAALVQSWRQRLGNTSAKRVGIVWGGRLRPDPRRSARLQDLALLAEIPGIELFSLQAGSARAQTASPPPGFHLIDLMDDVHDFADTAALIANLDLVISIDTAVAHLAGALGRPIWIMLPYVPSWRWLLDRTDSPWYPTMRLFRQAFPGDWSGVVQKVSAALREFCSNERE
jgi:tetratricopeptide (TPR) repeat protein